MVFQPFRLQAGRWLEIAFVTPCFTVHAIISCRLAEYGYLRICSVFWISKLIHRLYMARLGRNADQEETILVVK